MKLQCYQLWKEGKKIQNDIDKDTGGDVKKNDRIININTQCSKETLIERLRNENEDKTKTQMTQSFNQYSENETKIWRQNILSQFSHVSLSCLRSHFVISLISPEKHSPATETDQQATACWKEVTHS